MSRLVRIFAMALAIMTTVIASRSQTRADYFAMWLGDRLTTVISQSGRLEFWTVSDPTLVSDKHRKVLLDETTPVFVNDGMFTSGVANDAKPTWRYATADVFTYLGRRVAARTIWVPAWVFALPGVLVVVGWYRRGVERVRRRECRICVACGYDLRGSASERCSECGLSVVGEAENERVRLIERISRGLQSAGLSADSRAKRRPAG